MKREKEYKSFVPASVQLLFNNEKLELMKVLCLINALSKKSKKQRKLEEIVFYYSLVNFDLNYLFGLDYINKKMLPPSPNLYFRFQTKINNILLIMSQLEYIEINGSITNKVEEIKIKLLPLGMKFWDENKTDYFNELFDNYTNTCELINYSAANVKRIKEGNHE